MAHEIKYSIALGVIPKSELIIHKGDTRKELIYKQLKLFISRPQ